MATKRPKREVVLKTETPEGTPDVTVQRSSRNVPVPKRLLHFPDNNDESHNSKRKSSTNKETKIQKGAKRPKRNGATESGDVKEETKGYGQLSAYELERLENIRQNQAFLTSINLFQATQDLKDLGRSKPSYRGLRRKLPTVKEVLPPRKSLRLQKIEAETLALPPPATLPDDWYLHLKKPPGPLPMEAINMEGDFQLPAQLLELCSEGQKETKPYPDLNRYVSALKTMNITEEKVAKMVAGRIFSVAFHPCSSSLLMAAGDRLGHVGLWNLGGDWGEDGVLLFEPHTRPVGCMAFSRAQPTQLLSLSYDGSMRCMDIEKAVFDDMYNIDDGLKAFDFLSHDCSTLVVGTWSGGVAIVDRRTPGNSHESFHSVDPKVVRCVSVHPLQKQYVAVAENRMVSIYDSRHLKKTNSLPVSQLHGHSLSISSAYFSPCTGNRVLTSCLDNHIRVFDTSEMITNPCLVTSISHDMRTSRWLSKIAAVWDPKQEDCFAVATQTKSRQVKVFHESGRLLHSFADEDLVTTVLSLKAFHPTRNALMGGNASGRIHVFSS